MKLLPQTCVCDSKQKMAKQLILPNRKLFINQIISVPGEIADYLSMYNFLLYECF